MSWKVAAESAKAWLSKPDEDRLARMREAALAMTDAVPAAQKDAWVKLMKGLAREDDPKRKERAQALVRACRLFGGPAKMAKSSQKQADFAIDWRAPVDVLPGIGPQLRETLAESNVIAVADLLFQLPTRYDARRAPISLAEAIDLAPAGERVVFAATVASGGVVPMRGRRAVRLVLRSSDRSIHAWWFFLAHGILSLAKPGTACIVSGKITLGEKGPPRVIHPDFAVDDEAHRTVVPMGPRLGAPAGTIRKAVAYALAHATALPDPVPEKIVERESMPPLAPLLREVHTARDPSGNALVPSMDQRRSLFERLAFVEAFARARDRMRGEILESKSRAPALAFDRATHARLVLELGFPLTAAQKKAVSEVCADLAKDRPMRRLLLGDVGTGKTAVALAAVAQCVHAGAQAAILAPTTILAEQYMDAVAPLARATGVPIAFVGSGAKSTEKKNLEANLASGAISVAIGTHALFRESVQFKKLGLVVVDEQHRLGVAQRLHLSKKQGKSQIVPHLLTLSATPIPRSLALALRGELATSHLSERPKGRVPVQTEIVSRESFEAVVARIREACRRGERVFFVAPRIEVTGEDDVTDPSFGAVDRAKILAKLVAPFRVSLVHGAQKPAERMAQMRDFRAGRTQLLVGTTVIEVGVDVPEATLMIIDGAGRFGLAQLHQMRGRVGRGDKPGTCVLMYDERPTLLAMKRLEILRDHADGATIARKDLELRGGGDLGGTRQSGAEEELLYLDPASPPGWLARIDAYARAIDASDPKLEKPEHAALAHFVASVERALVVRAEAG